MPIKRKEDDKVDDDADSVNTSTSIKVAKRLRNSIKGKPSANDQDQKQSDTTSKANTSLNVPISNETRQTRNKSLANSSSKIEQIQYFEDFFDVICSFQDDTQRYLANIFYVLPSRKDYPDYYDTIKNPIDLKQIAKNVVNSKYKTLKQMEADLNLMLDNAKRYNDPKSVLYKDACKLKKLTKDICKELNGLMEKQKLYQSNKTREKKLKLLQEIAEMTGENDVQEDNNDADEGQEEEEEEEEVEENANQEEPEKEDGGQEEEADEDGDSDDSEAESAEEDEQETENKSKRSLNLNSTDEIDEPKTTNRRTKHNTKLISTMWSLFDHIKDFKYSNQSLIDPFLKLPSKRLYPDYYEEIKNPIAMNVIKKRLNKRLYKSFRDLINDLELIFKNAKQYNLEESLIYLNANRLLETLHQKSSEIQINIPDIFTQTNQVSSPSVLGTPTRKSVKQVLSKLAVETNTLSTLSVSNTQKLSQNIPKFTDLKEKMIYLYNYINDYQIDQRELAPPFRHLPSRTEYPDYYNFIKKPIDMTKIWNRINHAQNSYPTLDDMCQDFSLMFENACIYNEPTSTLYKDALNLQRALFIKRDEIFTHEQTVQPNDLNEMEYLPDDFVQNQIQELIENLFDACIQHQDLEGRVLSETFLDLYNLYDLESKETELEVNPIRTFDLVHQRIKQRVYHRLDAFQDEMFEVFHQIRLKSYLETNPENSKKNKYKIHRYSQLFKDGYDLQRYFIQKRDELCRNGELLLSGALSYKLTSLDSFITSVIGSSAHHFDESEALLVEQRFKKLESMLDTDTTKPVHKSNPSVGNFYYFEKKLIKSNLINKEDFSNQGQEPNTNQAPLIGCVLAHNPSKTKLIIQVYLKQTDEEFFDLNLLKTRKFFPGEVFKSDLYALIDLAEVNELSPCLVIGLKDHLISEANFSKVDPDAKDLIEIKKSDIYVCESIYSSCFHYFRKLTNKKWSPLQFISNHNQTQASAYNFIFIKRSIPLQIERTYLDDKFVQELAKKVDTKLHEIQAKNSLFKNFYRETIQYDSLPASFFAKEKEADEMETTQVETEDPEIMKTAKYYEQLVYKLNDTLYKLGDYVYIKYQQLSTNQVSDPNLKQPLIVRIDRLWSLKNQDTTDSFYLRGPVFLRPTDIPHEPTRLFYRNEVFKEISREITVNFDQIVGNKKCVVMNQKKYCSSRLTEINEHDVYVCETKYSLQNKTFRKFTKGLRKFELSLKCCEDEVYFMRKELQLRKHLSPLLVELKINYEDDSSDYLKNFNDPNNFADEDEWNEQMRDDENSSQSLTEHMDTTISNLNVNSNKTLINSLSINENSNSQSIGSTSVKKIRVKRAKKSGFNLFSKDFRKSLRDTQSSLSFTDMSKEVGIRWRALSDKERATYEERAVIETAKEIEKQRAAAAAEESAKLLQQQQQQQQQQLHQLQHQQSMMSPLTSHSANHIITVQAPQPLINQQTGMILQQTSNGLISKQGPPVLVYQQPCQQSTIVQNVQTIQPQVQNLSTQIEPRAVDQPKQVLHREAYIRYIANIKKQQQFNQSSVSNNPAANLTLISHSDWYKSIDVRPSRIKENRVMQPPSAWIENCSSGDVLQNLLSLRYYLLSDAISIERESFSSDQLENEQLNAQEDNSESLTVL